MDDTKHVKSCYETDELDASSFAPSLAYSRAFLCLSSGLSNVSASLSFLFISSIFNTPISLRGILS